VGGVGGAGGGGGGGGGRGVLGYMPCFRVGVCSICMRDVCGSVSDASFVRSSWSKVGVVVWCVCGGEY
jgi:hypothetical protein